MTLQWCSLFLHLVFVAELALAVVSDAAVQIDPKDIKMTIQSKNGETIDCVDIYKQPSLNNPLLKDIKHEIMRDIARVVAEQQDEETHAAAVEQEWHKSTRQCPIGSIPILRENPSIPDRTGLLPTPLHDNDNAPPGPRPKIAIAIAANGPYSGAYVLLPVWKPARVRDLESSATFLVMAGTVNPDFNPSPGVLPPDMTNQIAIGLYAHPGGDHNPELSIYYTPDGGRTVCFNLNCGGFVQTNRAIVLGASLVNGASGVNDHVPYVLVSIHKDPAGPWHVLVNDTELGYYPRPIFPWMFPEAAANLVGGSVFNRWPGGKHTDTVMGNGRRPHGDDKPAVAKGYVAVNLAGNPFNDIPDIIVHAAPNCYDVDILGQNNDTVGINVAFGGSGGANCA
ncbi:uncharacterized protein LOC125512899 [Triticum urartu]|uniref:uncharacterized protein LOC125512899 n=1 Tax=Triticum urartu TaxID=4572 RepID=UPI002043389C|nr:uncharacterized protein LOC125512899 [Triticum urartu]